MDKERLLNLADYLEHQVQEQKFDMVNWGSPSALYHDVVQREEGNCQTSGCIAGWAVALYGTKEERINPYTQAVASKLLGFSNKYPFPDQFKVGELFGVGRGCLHHLITPPIAAAFIRKFVEDDGATNWWDFLMGENGILRHPVRRD